MINFNLQLPVHLFFGKDAHKNIASQIPAGAKVLMTYGGGSIKTNGVYQKVQSALEGFEVVEFGGIEANPEYETLLRALKIIKEQEITFILAVGGGSVIDGTKFLSSAALFDGDTPWDILSKGIRTEVGMPFGTVLTLPATGSEMNSGAVISRKELNQKRPMGGPGLFPKFSICDPSVVASLPERQLANGIVDAFTHVMEQYMTYPTSATLQDRISEGILATLMEIAPKVMADPSDYDTAANFMWCCNMALNGIIQKGVPTDWSIHALGHEITALYGIDHARTLAIVLPSMYRYKADKKGAKLAQFSRRVLELSGSEAELAKTAVDGIENFFHSLDVPTTLSAYPAMDAQEVAPEKIVQNLEKIRTIKLGEHGDILREDALSVLQSAY